MRFVPLHKSIRYLLIRVACCAVLFAKAQEPVMRHFSLKEGLPSLELYQVYQDRAGFIWVCTDAGIARYNANSFKVFNSSNGLPDNTIFEVKEDKKNRMWYRSYTGKIGYIFHDTVFSLPANSMINEFQAEGIINSFAIDDSGNVILGKQNIKDISFLKISPPYSPANTKVIWKNTAKILGVDIHMINANDFVYSVKLVLDKITSNKYCVSVYNLPAGVPFHDSVYLDHLGAAFNRVMPLVNNKLELVTSNRLMEYDLSKKTVAVHDFFPDLITAYRDERIFLMSGHNTGLQCLESGEEEPATWLDNNTVTSVVKDRQDGYWLATLDNGLFYVSGAALKVFNTVSGKKGNRISRIEPLDETHYMVSFSDGSLKTMIMEGGRFRRLENFDLKGGPPEKEAYARFVLSFCRLPANKAVAFKGGNCLLLDLARKTVKPIVLQTSVYFMAIKKIIPMENRICMASYKDLCFLDTTDFLMKEKSVVSSEDRITSIAYDSENKQLFVGSVHGLYKYKGGQKISRDNRILDCLVENLEYVNGNLFVATKEKGLIVMGRKGTDTINQKKGLTGDVCKSLVIHGKDLWVLTNGGIDRVSYKDYGSYRIRSFPRNTFLFEGSINNLCITDSFMYFSSGDDLYAFPYTREPPPGPFYIKSFSAGGRPLDPLRPTVLSYDAGNITVSYEALFYANARHIEYRYRMQAGDTSWNYTSETSITFPSLAPGAYSLIIEAKANSGQWICNEKPIVFSVSPPFWLKWWFVAGEIVLLAGLVVLVIAVRYGRKLKKERERNKVQNKIYELEAQATKAQMNPHFIFNSLNSIQQFILGSENEKAFSYLTRFSKLIRKLLESNRSGDLSLEAEAEILEKYIEIESLRFKGSFSYEVKVEKEVVASNTRIPHMMVQPFVENAIWHGLLHKKDDRQLSVSFSRLDSRTLLCVIDDNGVGRKKSQHKKAIDGRKSLGVSFITERLLLFSKLKGAAYGVNFVDKVNAQGESGGTRVEIKLPILD